MTSNKNTPQAPTHTPGPWHFHPNEDGKPIYNHGKFAIAYMDAYEPEEDDGGLWEKETEANGNLVAAAPDLLEALKGAATALQDIISRATHGQPYSREELFNLFIADWAKAHTAISKALPSDGRSA